MKIRDSGMPEEGVWAGFFDPVDALRRLGLDAPTQDIVDMGCGYGTFTVAAAMLTDGIVHAFDIDPTMIAATRAQAKRSGLLSNIRAACRDFLVDGTGLSDESVNFVMLFNILHAEEPVMLLREAFRILKPRSTVAVMHWISDGCTPRGPPLDIRPRPEQCIDWMRIVGFEVSAGVTDLPPYHFGLTGRKPSSHCFD